MTRRWQTWVLGVLALAVVAAAVQAGTEYYVGNSSDALVGNFRYIYPGTGTYVMQWQNANGDQVAQIDQNMGIKSDTGIQAVLFGGASIGIFAASNKFGINVDTTKANALTCGGFTTGGYAYLVKPFNSNPTQWLTIIGSNMNGCTEPTEYAQLTVKNFVSGNTALLVKGATAQAGPLLYLQSDATQSGHILQATDGTTDHNILFAIRWDGDILTSRVQANTVPGTQNKRLPIYNTNGSLAGYVPLYN